MEISDILNKIAIDIGTIEPPVSSTRLTGVSGIGGVLAALMKLLVLGAGIYAVFNFILAGYAYISSSGDPKGIQIATAKIWHSVVGLVVAASALVIARIVGQLVFGSQDALIDIQIY